ncbi:hypothetical protein ACE939_11460 [Aquimarina sp. W85]|uniref:hypothetical protein n=1 Tax=Aquimarina rhodophyticola TaxID=3342246 RepID=UPI00366FAB13
MSKKNHSQAALLAQYRVALDNAKNQPEIATEMAELGFDIDTLNAGDQLLAQTRAAYDFKQLEDDETVAASTNFKEAKKQLETYYRRHRKKARVIYKNNPTILKQLGIYNTVPYNYAGWLETIRKFYTTNDSAILKPLERLKITAEDMITGLNYIKIVEQARSEFLKETGESEDATKQKEKAFATLENWMQEFYAVAAIALEDHPQLMEAIGRKRKS